MNTPPPHHMILERSADEESTVSQILLNDLFLFQLFMKLHIYTLYGKIYKMQNFHPPKVIGFQARRG